MSSKKYDLCYFILQVYNDSVEKALYNYLKPETLDGDNKYNCPECDKKVKAQKGFKFVKLPKILCL